MPDEKEQPAHEREHFPPLPPGTAPLWAGLLGAPLAWALQLQITYALVERICWNGKHFILHLTTLATLLVAVACAMVCWMYVPRHDRTGPGEPRIRFLSLFGLLTSALLALVIVAQGIATFFIDPCLR
jgi:uncharacterized membrane protein